MVEIKNLATALQMLQQTDGVQDALQALSGLAGGAATPAVPGLQIFAGKAKEKTPEPHAAGEQSSTALPTPPATIPAAAAPTSAIQNGEADQVTAKAELGDGPEAQSANGADKNLQDYEEAAFAALQRKRGPGLKRPAAAPSKTTPAGSKKPFAGPKKSAKPQAAKGPGKGAGQGAGKIAGNRVLKLGCKTCRGTKRGCNTCRNPGYKGERMNRSEWKALAAMHGWK
jgi:hypothetical protein